MSASKDRAHPSPSATDRAGALRAEPLAASQAEPLVPLRGVREWLRSLLWRDAAAEIRWLRREVKFWKDEASYQAMCREAETRFEIVPMGDYCATCGNCEDEHEPNGCSPGCTFQPERGEHR